MADLYKHIFVTGNAKTEKFKKKGSPVNTPPLPDRNRINHSNRFLQQFDAIWAEKKRLNQARSAENITTRDGTYLSFKSAANHDLITKSLESLRGKDSKKWIRLLNVKTMNDADGNRLSIATVYIPNGKEGLFISKINSYRTKNNTTIIFPIQIDHNIVTEVINRLGNNIRLKSIKDAAVDDVTITKASIQLPVEQEDYFVAEISKIFPNTEIKITPSNSDLVNSVEDVSITLLEGLWTDKIELIPRDNAKWCEAWLNVNTKEQKEKTQIAEFLSTLTNIGIPFKPNTIMFPERAVLLINANRAQLIELMQQSDLLAEFRSGQDLAGFWVREKIVEQQTWIDDLLNRLEIVESNLKICLLDSGVNNGHPLLQPLIDDANVLAVNPVWETNDHESRSGHGTLMAGIAGYGKLEEALASTANVAITHKLCSVKILPPPSQEPTPRELWGDVTAQGIARAEIQNPKMTLIYCMSVTSKIDAEKGRPSSWSGAVDNLVFGEGENQRLVIISAGNILDHEDWQNYPNSNFVTTIENPAQSWNALTVGAYTEKIQVNDAAFSDYLPVANRGELSPFSSTSYHWEKKWPIKPDVVFEGGNLLKAPDSTVTEHEDLEMLSTSKTFNTRPFDTINATSAASAQASWFATKIAYEYPRAWPETIRGLMVHAANWHPAMLKQMNVRPSNKGDYRRLLQVFGFGVPQLERALYSRESALTIIAQETIQPFGFSDKNQPETKEVHFFNFPWPKEILLEMGEAPVILRITLSYFIEAAEGRIGWKEKYRYQSHGLRFDVNNVGEREEVFRKRVNVAAREQDERVESDSGSERWKIGKDNRAVGSIQSDIWEGTAAELATCNLIAVYPVIGWWRERKHLGKVENKTLYSLIISLDTPAQDVELYTTVKNMIEVPIEIRV